MTSTEESQGQTNATGKGIIISVLLTVEDFERLKKAFAEGKLKSLGISDVRVVSRKDGELPRETMEPTDLSEKGKTSAEENGRS